MKLLLLHLTSVYCSIWSTRAT